MALHDLPLLDQHRHLQEQHVLPSHKRRAWLQSSVDSVQCPSRSQLTQPNEPDSTISPGFGDACDAKLHLASWLWPRKYNWNSRLTPDSDTDRHVQEACDRSVEDYLHINLTPYTSPPSFLRRYATVENGFPPKSLCLCASVTL